MFARQGPGPVAHAGHPMSAPNSGLASQPRAMGMGMGMPPQQARPLAGSPVRNAAPPPGHQQYPGHPMYGGPPPEGLGPPGQPGQAQAPSPYLIPASIRAQQQHQYSVEQAISQSLPPGVISRPYASPNASHFAQPARPAPPPTSHPFPRPPPQAAPRAYDSPPQYADQARQNANGSHHAADPVASSSHDEHRIGPDAGTGPSPAHRDSHLAPDERQRTMHDAHRRATTGQPPVEPEPSHRVLFHSYILDYLQKQGFHATAAAFLQDAPDTNVKRPTTADRAASHKGKGRAFPDDELKPSLSDYEHNSPHPPRGTSGDDLNSPAGTAGVGPDSIASTNSSLSNFGFAAQSNGTSPPQSSPESAHLALLPRASVQIETREGFLFEWWAVFWDVFRARSGKGGTPSARTFVDVSNATIDAIAQRRKQISFDDPLSLPELQQINPQAFMPPYGIPAAGQLQHRAPPARAPQDPNAPPYPLQRRPSLGGPGQPGMPRPPPSLPMQMTAAQAAQHAENQARFRQPPPGANAGPPPPQGGAPPPAAVSRLNVLARRGAISPAPLPSIPLGQGPEAASAMRQRQMMQQQEGARHAQQQAMQAQHHQQLAQQQQAMQHHNAAAEQARYNAAYQTQEVHRAQAAQQAMAGGPGGRFSRPSSAIGHNGHPPPPRQPSQTSNHGSPYPPGEAPSSPNKSYAMVQNVPMDPNRQKYLPGYGTPQSGFSVQPQMDAYRAQLGANQSHALAAVQQTSPRLDVAGSPYLADRPTPTPNGLPQGGPSPYATYLGTPEYLPAGGSSPAFSGAPAQPGQQPYPNSAGNPSRPASAAGSAAFREQQQGGSMPPPPPSGPPARRPAPSQQPGSNAPTPQAAQAPTPQALAQTPGASQYGSPGVTPQTPNSAAAALPGAKRKRESTKDVREPKKRATKGRDRSGSNASNVQAPTPSPVPVPASIAGEYMQSPSSMLEASPRPTLVEPHLSEQQVPTDNNGLLSDPALAASVLADQFHTDEMPQMFSSTQNGYEPHHQHTDASYGYALEGAEGTYHDPLGLADEFNFEDYMNFPEPSLSVEPIPDLEF